jgi:putative DNA primase/helicase
VDRLMLEVQDIDTVDGSATDAPVAISDAPDLLFERLTKPKPRSSAAAISMPPGARLPQVGGRNDGLARFAGSLRRQGFDQTSLEAACLTFNSSFPEPLPEDEVRRVAQSISRYDPAVEINEQALSEQFVNRSVADMRYVPASGWKAYRDGRWKDDTEGLEAQERSKQLVSAVKAGIEAAQGLDGEEKNSLRKKIASMQRRAPIDNIVRLARSHKAIVDFEPWDQDAGLVNFRNGTLRLPSLELKPHDPADRLTKILPYDYDPDADCPLFERVLDDALDTEEGRFLLRFYGYGLMGHGGLQKMLVLLGKGRNGKSTIGEAVANAMKSYAVSADPTTFMKTKFEKSSTNDIARLEGARLVTVSEWPDGKQFDAALLKRFNGDENLTARLLYKENIEFTFRGLLAFRFNSMPVFNGGDFAMVRRLRALRFNRTIPDNKVDRDLPAKLRKEAAGIMNLLVRGALDFVDNGLDEPPSVRAETAALAAAADPLRQFIEEKCNLSGQVQASQLYQAYVAWARADMGIAPMSQPAFKGQLLDIRGVTQSRASQGQFWYGISFKK